MQQQFISVRRQYTRVGRALRLPLGGLLGFQKIVNMDHMSAVVVSHHNWLRLRNGKDQFLIREGEHRVVRRTCFGAADDQATRMIPPDKISPRPGGVANYPTHKLLLRDFYI